MKKYRLAIIEDEIHIRQGIKALLKANHPDLEVVAEAASISEAVKCLNHVRPDIVLMDIHLQDGISFGIFEKVVSESFALIFITAYDHYAIKAIKLNALDYLLKPIDEDEFTEALAKARQSKTSLQKLNFEAKPATFTIHTTQGRYIIPYEELVRCQANEGYTLFYLASGKKHMASKPLKYFVDIFPESTFLRVHQSHLVNIHFIQKYTQDTISLKETDALIPISYRKRKAVHQRLSAANDTKKN